MEQRIMKQSFRPTHNSKFTMRRRLLKVFYLIIFFASNVKCLCETLNFCLLACVVCSLALLPNEHFETHSIASFYCHFLPTDCYVYDIKSIESAQSWVVWIHSSHFQHQIHSFTLKNGICSAKNISLPLERGN